MRASGERFGAWNRAGGLALTLVRSAQGRSLLILLLCSSLFSSFHPTPSDIGPTIHSSTSPSRQWYWRVYLRPYITQLLKTSFLGVLSYSWR